MEREYIGIDLHKAFFQACAITSRAERRWEERWPTSDAGIAALLTRCGGHSSLAVEASSPTWAFVDRIVDHVGAVHVVPLLTAMQAVAASDPRLHHCTFMDDVLHEKGQFHARIGFMVAPIVCMTSFLKAFAISALLLAPASLANAQVTFGVRIGQAPPPPRWYRVPAQPRPDYEWIEGYWYPQGGRYAWRDGYWARPPYAGAYWAAPYYSNGRYFSGRWEGNRGRYRNDRSNRNREQSERRNNSRRRY